MKQTIDKYLVILNYETLGKIVPGKINVSKYVNKIYKRNNR